MSETLSYFIGQSWSDLNKELELRASDPSRPYANLQAILDRWPADELSRAGAADIIKRAKDARPRMLATVTRLRKGWGK